MGFDTSSFKEYEKELLSLAKIKIPKQSKKFLKKSASKLTKVNKNAFKSSNAAAGSGTTEAEMLKAFKAGKVYEFNGDLSCRAYSAHPLAHLLDQGFVYKGGGFKIKNGKEKWIPGYGFMDKSKNSFQSTYYTDVQNFINDMLNNNGL